MQRWAGGIIERERERYLSRLGLVAKVIDQQFLLLQQLII